MDCTSCYTPPISQGDPPHSSQYCPQHTPKLFSWSFQYTPTAPSFLRSLPSTSSFQSRCPFLRSQPTLRSCSPSFLWNQLPYCASIQEDGRCSCLCRKVYELVSGPTLSDRWWAISGRISLLSGSTSLLIPSVVGFRRNSPCSIGKGVRTLSGISWKTRPH